MSLLLRFKGVPLGVPFGRNPLPRLGVEAHALRAEGRASLLARAGIAYGLLYRAEAAFRVDFSTSLGRFQPTHSVRHT